MTSKTAKQPIRRYFFDCEFNENRPANGKTLYDIDFISIAIVSEDGEVYYAVNKDCDPDEAGRHPWLAQHVVPKLPPKPLWKDVADIRKDLLDFIRPAEKVEFWARNNAYDVVTLCRLFGTMQAMKEDLKARGIDDFEFCDINYFRRDPDIDWNRIPRKEEAKAHAADYDAGFELTLYRHIMNLKKTRAPKP